MEDDLIFKCKWKIRQILKKGKKQYIYNYNLANQEGTENIKTHDIEKIENTFSSLLIVF